MGFLLHGVGEMRVRRWRVSFAYCGNPRGLHGHELIYPYAQLWLPAARGLERGSHNASLIIPLDLSPSCRIPRGGISQLNIFSFKDCYMHCPITSFTHCTSTSCFKVLILPCLQMLAIITIKSKSKINLVKFISKTYLTDFKICIYLEIIEVE